jgi:Holliday junction resolvase RusA-like endonuclease
VSDKSTEAIIIDLPLPHRVLHPNGRTRKHGWRAKLVREHRAMACLVARGHAPKKPFKSARYSLTFNLPRTQDEDNLGAWIKAYLDGLQSGGIIENDSRLTRDSLTVVSGKKQTGGKYGVRIEIRGSYDCP